MCKKKRSSLLLVFPLFLYWKIFPPPPPPSLQQKPGPFYLTPAFPGVKSAALAHHAKVSEEVTALMAFRRGSKEFGQENLEWMWIHGMVLVCWIFTAYEMWVYIYKIFVYTPIPRIMYIDPIRFGKKHVCGPLGFPWQLFCWKFLGR